METRLSRGEYWILNSAVDCRVPVSFLQGDDPFRLFDFSRTGHGLSRDFLVATLGELFERGWITASLVPWGESSDEEQEIGKLSPEAIVSALDGPRPMSRMPFICYGLTHAGASVWEGFAAPKWERFLDVGISIPGEFIGATEWRIHRYFDLVHHIGIEIVPGTVAWDEVRPWEATYWKTLPVGYRVRFEHRDAERTSVGWDKVPHEVMSLRHWYDWK